MEDYESEVIPTLVNELMATEYAVAPNNSLVSEKVWKERKREELTAFFSGKEILQRMDAAIETLTGYLKSHLSQVEIQDIVQELESMKFNEKTLNIFYSVGTRYHEEQDYHAASDIFFLLSLMDDKKYDIWLALGLSELKNSRFEDALTAFAMASITNNSEPLPYIYSAECCIALDRKQESINYLDLAQDVLELSQSSEKDVLLNQIKNLMS